MKVKKKKKPVCTPESEAKFKEGFLPNLMYLEATTLNKIWLYLKICIVYFFTTSTDHFFYHDDGYCYAAFQRFSIFRIDPI